MIGHRYFLTIERTPIIIATKEQHTFYRSWCANRKVRYQAELATILGISVARNTREINLTPEQCRIQARRYTRHKIDIIVLLLFMQQTIIDWLYVQVCEDTEGYSSNGGRYRAVRS